MKDINLMPKEYFVKSKKKKLVFFLLFFGSILTGFIIMGIMMPYRMIDIRRNELSDLNLHISDGKYRVVNELKKELIQKQKETDLLQKILNEVEKESVVRSRTLDCLTGFLPPKMYIQKLNINNETKSIYIEGNADQSESISEYVVQLSNLPFVEKINMKTNITFSDNGDKLQSIKYELVLQMKKEEAVFNQDETQIQ